MKYKLFNFAKTIFYIKKRNIYLFGLLFLYIYKNRYLINKTNFIDFLFKVPYLGK